MYASDLWEPHFVKEAAVCLLEEEGRNKKLKEVKHGAGDPIVRTHHEICNYHYYYLPQRTRIRTPHTDRMFCFGEHLLLKTSGTQFRILYGIHISKSYHIYLSIQIHIYI